MKQLVICVVVALLGALGGSVIALRAQNKARFWMIKGDRLGEYQTAYLIKDGQTSQCVLVIEASANPYQTLAVTSQPWPCQ